MTQVGKHTTGHDNKRFHWFYDLSQTSQIILNLESITFIYNKLTCRPVEMIYIISNDKIPWLGSLGISALLLPQSHCGPTCFGGTLEYIDTVLNPSVFTSSFVWNSNRPCSRYLSTKVQTMAIFSLKGGTWAMARYNYMYMLSCAHVVKRALLLTLCADISIITVKVIPPKG